MDHLTDGAGSARSCSSIITSTSKTANRLHEPPNGLLPPGLPSAQPPPISYLERKLSAVCPPMSDGLNQSYRTEEDYPRQTLGWGEAAWWVGCGRL